MFSKILALKNFGRVPKNVLITQRFAPTSQYSISQNLKYLHIKIYDKHPGLESKRATNKFSHIDEPKSESDHILLSNDNKWNTNLHKEKQISNQTLINEEEDLNPTVLVAEETDNDPDIFGNAPKEPIQEDEGDLIEEEYISRPTRRAQKLSTKEYSIMIKNHLDSHQLKKAIEVLEVRMLKEDRVKPESYIYNLLISGCAKAGYTRKAFNLYTKMRQRGLKVKESIYTSLFNACANAPSRQDGLTRTIRLRDSLLESGYEYNVKNYNAMIKAFGRWGDVKTAYILADEMRDKKLPITAETFNFLLQACASDEKHGFRHCLLTWHKMLEKKIQPDYYSFNAVLRCVRDCGLGDLDAMERVLQQILNEKNLLKSTLEKDHNSNIENITPTPAESENNTKSIALNQIASNNSLQIQNETPRLELPNILAAQPHLGSMMSLSEVQKPHERFLLLGGLTGFLELMKSYKITPNIQTFTTILEVIPPTNTAEKQVLTYIRKIGLKADIDFFNILIKKRAMRFDYEGGKEVLSMIRTAGLHPDIVTYGVLALGCTTIESSRELIYLMRQNDMRMNVQILGAMLRQGCALKNFPYICEVMQISLDDNIKPNEIFLRHLNNFYVQCARAIDARHPTTKTKNFKKMHMKFCDKYRLYQEEHGIEGVKLEDAIKKIKERPYNQFQEEELEGVEPLKNEKLARKQKQRKYIKKIKIQNLKGDDDLTKNTELLLFSDAERIDNKAASLQKANEEEDQLHYSKKQNSNNPFRIVHA